MRRGRAGLRPGPQGPRPSGANLSEVCSGQTWAQASWPPSGKVSSPCHSSSPCLGKQSWAPGIEHLRGLRANETGMGLCQAQSHLQLVAPSAAVFPGAIYAFFLGGGRAESHVLPGQGPANPPSFRQGRLTALPPLTKCLTPPASTSQL